MKLLRVFQVFLLVAMTMATQFNDLNNVVDRIEISKDDSTKTVTDFTTITDLNLDTHLTRTCEAIDGCDVTFALHFNTLVLVNSLML